MLNRITKLDHCTPLRQTLEAQPPVLLHASAAALVGLLLVAIGWAALTPANLVVRATGRVRAASPPTKIFASASGKMENRVAAVYVQEGAVVRQGQMMLEFDTQRLDNEIGRLERTIATAEHELSTMNMLRGRLEQQFQTAQAKAETELAQATGDHERSRMTQQSEVRRAEAELTAARDQFERTERLSQTQVATKAALVEAETKLRCAEEKLRIAQLPIDGNRVLVLERAIELVGNDHQVRVAELEERQVAKQGEADAAAKDLANLNLQREQAVLRAPIDGVVVQGRHHVGDLVEPGKSVFEVASAGQLCFESNVVSHDVGRLVNGMPTHIKFDAYDYQRYGSMPGQVAYISPDSTVQNESQKAASTYVVQVKFDGRELVRGELRGQIKLGMAGRVEIVTDTRSLLAILLKRIQSAISLG